MELYRREIVSLPLSLSTKTKLLSHGIENIAHIEKQSTQALIEGETLFSWNAQNELFQETGLDPSEAIEVLRLVRGSDLGALHNYERKPSLFQSHYLEMIFWIARSLKGRRS